MSNTFNHISVSEFHGTVISKDKNSETHISGGDGQVSTDIVTGRVKGRTNAVKSKTTYTTDLFLQDANGKEHHFNVPANLTNIRQGHDVQLIWITNQKNPQPDYIVVKNLTLNSTPVYNKRKINPIALSAAVFFISAIILSFIPVPLYIILSPLAAVLVYRKLKPLQEDYDKLYNQYIPQQLLESLPSKN